tara:strand:- start:1021 stop:2364 length:1344 start_codon:yes stop_codon:yes gene_type:complete
MEASDSLIYSKSANYLSKDFENNLLPTASTRIGLVSPVALSYSIFGISDFSSVLFILLTSLGNVILIFYFGKLLFNRKTGLIAAFMMSFFPLDVVYSTRLLSDLPSAFFMALGVYIFLYYEKNSDLNNYFGYLFSGIFIGIGYLIRESALLIALFFITYILYKRKIKKEYFLIVLGVLLIILAETFILYLLTGDPLARFNASQGYNTEALTNVYNYFGRLDFPTGLFHYPWLFFTNKLLLYFYIFIFMAICYTLIFKKKSTYTILFWFSSLLLYLSFGSSSFSRFIPFKAADRYLTIVSIPGILILAFFLSEKNKIIRKVIAPVTILILLIISIGTIYLIEDRNQLDDLRNAYTFLENSDKDIFIDKRSLLTIEYISKFNTNLKLNEYPPQLSNIKDSLVVINNNMIKELTKARPDKTFPNEIDNIPTNWNLVWESGPNNIQIYYVP